jgi:6-pyruvoyltetrahydropterin/6-carboxytetrahydropterin synthase
MIVSKFIEIDMGHRVMNHKSKCRNIHGHRYKIEVAVDDKIITSKGVSDEGMVIDYGDLKQVMMEVLDKTYDHGFIISTEDPYYNMFRTIGEQDNMKIIGVPFIPTAENLAKHWYGSILIPLKERKITLLYVKVWETPTSTAICRKSDYYELDESPMDDTIEEESIVFEQDEEEF